MSILSLEENERKKENINSVFPHKHTAREALGKANFTRFASNQNKSIKQKKKHK